MQKSPGGAEIDLKVDQVKYRAIIVNIYNIILNWA